jgi:riboflavin biosynthesis pyrimidine reductase
VTGPGWKRSLSVPASIRLAWHETEAHPRDVPVGDLYAPLTFPASPGPLPYVIANMVMTQNGEAAIEGRAATIGTAVDGIVLTRLRAATDAVLTGIGTVIAEDAAAVLPDAEAARRAAAGRPPRLLVAALASRPAWPDEVLTRRFFTDPRFEKVVITGAQASPEDIRRVEARGVEVVRVLSDPEGRPDVLEALRSLRRRGAGCIVSEGGPRVLASLFRAQAVREYFLTTSPLLTGDSRAPRPVAGEVLPQGAALLLARVSRYEYEFQDPRTRARLVEAYDRFRVIYPSSSPGV